MKRPVSPGPEPGSDDLTSVDPRRATVAAYEADARQYVDGRPEMPSHLLAEIAQFASRLGPGAEVLEIGSGSGRDALALEDRGLSVRRTDITPAFVDLLRRAGHEADVLDPLIDDLGGPWDGVWTNACLLHLARAQMQPVLARCASATRPGGLLYLSVKEGDGEGWSRHGKVAAPRHFTYWREEPLRAAAEAAGWRVERIAHVEGIHEPWLELLAVA